MGCQNAISLLQLFSVYIEHLTYRYHILYIHVQYQACRERGFKGIQMNPPHMLKIIALGGLLTSLAIEESLLLSKKQSLGQRSK